MLVPNVSAVASQLPVVPQFRQAGACPDYRPLATFAWAIITGDIYHSTRVHALLHTIVPYMEAAYILSDVDEPEFCATKLKLPPRVVDQVNNDPRCTKRAASDRRHCQWMVAQLRWPWGLLHVASLQYHAHWISIIDDDSFIVVPTVVSHLMALQHAQNEHAQNELDQRGWFHRHGMIYAVGMNLQGGAGHYFNRAWAREFCNGNQVYCKRLHQASAATDGTNYSRENGGRILSTSVSTLWCGEEDKLRDFKESSDGGMKRCHDAFAKSRNETTYVDLRSRGAASLFLPTTATAVSTLRSEFDVHKLEKSPDVFASTFLDPVIHVTLKWYAESAHFLYNLFYRRQLHLLMSI